MIKVMKKTLIGTSAIAGFFALVSVIMFVLYKIAELVGANPLVLVYSIIIIVVMTFCGYALGGEIEYYLNNRKKDNND